MTANCTFSWLIGWSKFNWKSLIEQLVVLIIWQILYILGSVSIGQESKHSPLYWYLFEESSEHLLTHLFFGLTNKLASFGHCSFSVQEYCPNEL